MKKNVLALIALALASLACSLGGTGTSGNSQSASNKTVLFSDNFSDTSSGWDSYTSDDGTVVTDYANEAYRIFVNKPKYFTWANPGQSFDGDVIITVDVTKTGGPEDNEFGLICRYKDKNNFYIFKTSSDGYAQIGKYSDGNFIGLSGDQLDQVSGLNSGTTTNHLRADCAGNTLTLYANNNKLLTATDSELASGDVGLYAGAFDTAGTDVLFDNFLVTKP
jgi:hypothetical protein